MSWHLVRCAFGRLLPKIRDTIRSEVGEAECFFREEMVLQRGLLVNRRYPLFETPYIFADWPTEDAVAWHAVKRIRGVVSIAGGVYPAVISAGEVEAWQSLANDSGLVSIDDMFRLPEFEAGDILEFSLGAFEEKVGEFVGYKGRSVGVKIPFLGSETVIYLSPNIVRRRSESEPDLATTSALDSRTHRYRRSKRGGRVDKSRYDTAESNFPVTRGAPPLLSMAI